MKIDQCWQAFFSSIFFDANARVKFTLQEANGEKH